MSVQIKIATVDKSENVPFESVQLQRALTSQVDTLKFNVVRKGAGEYKPAVQDDVKLYEDSVQLFGGTIVEINEIVEGADVETFECTCKDYSYDMDKTLVIEVYENQTVNAIIADIQTNFLPAGYTITGVDCPIVVGYIAFNYEYPSKCFQQLAELAGADWYVDENKDIHFFLKETENAPFNLTDTNAKYYYNTLKIKSSISNLRNTIIVRGGTYRGTTMSEKQIADGVKTTFTQAYQYSSVTVKVAGASKTVGVDFIDDPTTKDCLYNFNEKSVKFPDASKPTDGQEVEVGGEPHIPVIVKVKDAASIALYGAYEYKIVDKSINTKQGARDRAKAEITNWAQSINDGSFETMQTGLKVGQKININSVIRGIDRDYIISRISSKLVNGQQFNHSIVLVTTQTFGVIEFLQKLLMAKDKEIVISQDEVLDVIESVNEDIAISDGTPVVSKAHNPQTETINIGEANTVQALDYPVEFCAGVQTPDGYKRQFIVGGSPLG